MKMNTFNELKQKSKKGKCFIVMENEQNEVCEKLDLLRFKDTNLIEYINNFETSYNGEIQALQEKIDKQDKIINELISAIKTLNGGV